MPHPPDPKMRRPATLASDGTKIASGDKHPPYIDISPDVQALIAVLTPLCLVLLLLALAGGRQ